jgi:hypothetical protein
VSDPSAYLALVLAGLSALVSPWLVGQLFD